MADLTDLPRQNRYKNASGTLYLRGLFYETTLSDKSSVVYTLKDEDHMGYPSLYRLYMASDDLTEYTFATAHLDGWAHWESLCQCNWFKPYVARWRRELETRAKAQALVAIREIADTNSKDRLAANKFLLQNGWKPTPNKRGRPTKEEISSEAARIAEAKSSMTEDFERITAKH